MVEQVIFYLGSFGWLFLLACAISLYAKTRIYNGIINVLIHQIKWINSNFKGDNPEYLKSSIEQSVIEAEKAGREI